MERAEGPGAVEIERHVDCDVIRLLGEHDMATRDSLWVEVAQSVMDDRGVVISLTDAEFIDSGVINILFKGDLLLQERGRRLVVHVQTASVVRRTLEVTSVCDSLPCFGDIEAALASASGRGSDPSWNTE